MRVLRHGDACVELRLDRPAQRNAVTTDSMRQLRDHLIAIGDDRTVKVVVLTGEGDGFCSGADLAEFSGDQQPDPADTLARVRLVISAMRGLLELEAVTIAAVHGPAIGAGWGLALGCDVCWAAEGAVFSMPEVAKGFRAPRVIVTRLGQVVGPVRAAELVLSGRSIDVDEAMAMGAVSRRCAGRDELHAASIEFATQLAQRPRAVLRGAVDPLRELAVPGAAPEIEYQWPER